jgi:Putative zinc-finger
MTPRTPDDLPPDWLAAYADGELSPEDRARVEQWLAEDPEARELLDAQESLGRSNTEFWNAVRPQSPSPSQWAGAFGQIAPRANPPRRAWAGWLGTAGLLATAATLILAMPGPQNPCLNAPPDDLPGAPAPSVDDEPYAMASADDVRIISLPEAAARLILVGEHPLGDSIVLLAQADEIVYYGVGSDLAGRFPEVPADPNAQDPPMIWAPR